MKQIARIASETVAIGFIIFLAELADWLAHNSIYQVVAICAPVALGSSLVGTVLDGIDLDAVVAHIVEHVALVAGQTFPSLGGVLALAACGHADRVVGSIQLVLLLAQHTLTFTVSDAAIWVTVAAIQYASLLTV